MRVISTCHALPSFSRVPDFLSNCEGNKQAPDNASVQLKWSKRYAINDAPQARDFVQSELKTLILAEGIFLHTGARL